MLINNLKKEQLIQRTNMFKYKRYFFINLIFMIYFLIKQASSAQFEMSVTGTDNYLHNLDIKDTQSFIVYENKFQFTTNTIIYGFGKCVGTIEMTNGQQDQNIICQFKDNKKNIGYMRSVPASEKNIKELQIGKIIGTSIAYWEWVSGTGPFSELIGLKIPCAYFAMEESNWMSKCKFEISDNSMKRINGVTTD